ncbi:hypothetical protein VPHK391_0033 [Vibrio phage K391]
MTRERFELVYLPVMSRTLLPYKLTGLKLGSRDVT